MSYCKFKTLCSFLVERQICREKVGEMVGDKIMYIAESMNKHEYVPKMPNQSELDLVFDTSLADVQPYLYKVWRNSLDNAFLAMIP